MYTAAHVMENRYHQQDVSFPPLSSSPVWSEKINPTAFAGSALTFTSPLGTFPCPPTPESNYSAYTNRSPQSNHSSPSNSFSSIISSPPGHSMPAHQVPDAPTMIHPTPLVPTPVHLAGPGYLSHCLSMPHPADAPTYQNLEPRKTAPSNYGHMYQSSAGPLCYVSAPIMPTFHNLPMEKDVERNEKPGMKNGKRYRNAPSASASQSSSHAAYAKLNRERRKKYIADLECYRAAMKKKKVQDASTLNKLREESAQLKTEIAELRKALMNNKPLMTLLTGSPRANSKTSGAERG